MQLWNRHYGHILSLSGNDKLNCAAAYGNMGNVHLTRGDLDQALAMYEKALAINEELGRKQGMAIQYDNMGIVYKTRGDLSRASEYWKESLRLYTKIGAEKEKTKVQGWIEEECQGE
ncbi:MAG: tetratricopeptide repeat protein [Desulfohalobiaceae bacterium]|nr:tetratricopeptide repeat protein [Desulfohalobiaceae bacterium]